MSQPILVTGAAGGRQGSTGNRVAQLLVQRGLKVRALVHQVDERSERLRKLGAEVMPGNLLDPDLAAGLCKVSSELTSLIRSMMACWKRLRSSQWPRARIQFPERSFDTAKECS